MCITTAASAPRPTVTGSWRCARSTPGAPGRPVRSVVALSTRGEPPDETTLLEGHDFFGSPRVHPDGDRLAVVVWDHPDMPWDASAVLVLPLARMAGATPGSATLEADGAPWLVAGGPEESVGQPAWAHDGSLRFVSDRRGWWQPYAHSGRPGAAPEAGALTEVPAEFHGPDWVLGQTTMAEMVDGTVVARMTASGRDALVLLVPGRPAAAPAQLPQPCVSISALCAHADGLALIGSTPDAPANVWVWTPDGAIHPLRPPPEVVLGRGDVALGEPFTLTGRSGRAVHGTLYRPTRHGTTGPADRRPPLVTWCHGGPTSVLPVGVRSHPAVLHDPRIRRGLRRLCGEHRVRAPLPLRAVGPMGRRRRRGLPRRGAISRHAATSTRTAWRSGAAAPVA